MSEIANPPSAMPFDRTAEEAAGHLGVSISTTYRYFRSLRVAGLLETLWNLLFVAAGLMIVVYGYEVAERIPGHGDHGRDQRLRLLPAQAAQLVVERLARRGQRQLRPPGGDIVGHDAEEPDAAFVCEGRHGGIGRGGGRRRGRVHLRRRDRRRCGRPCARSGRWCPSRRRSRRRG